MGKLLGSLLGRLPFARSVKAVAAVAGACTLLAPGLSFACDDDYPTNAGWAPYPERPPVVVVDPRGGYDGYDRRDDWRRERAARAYWYWRGRHSEREHRHHHRGHWD